MVMAVPTLSTPNSSRNRDSTLDLLRGLSALLVMLGHLRGFIFVDFGELVGAGLLTKAFYFATGLGHQAVMVFFVLSGYFVGGSIISGLMKGRFSWSVYSQARLTRLWVVLFPALLLTLAFDTLGHAWNPNAYAGELGSVFMSGPRPDQPISHSATTFLGNLAFVQTVFVPVYGTNGPLWSLANEFWYYVMFPLVAVALVQIFRGERRWLPFFQLLLFSMVVYLLPLGLVEYGLIWVMGVMVWGLVWKMDTKKQRMFSIFRGWPLRIVGGLIFLGTLAMSKSSHWLGSDYAVAAAFALWLISLSGSSPRPRLWKHAATGLSEISFTLYVVHFPLMFFAASVFLRGQQFPADTAGFLWFGSLAVTVLVISSVLWYLFERNTGWVRKRIQLTVS